MKVFVLIVVVVLSFLEFVNSAAPNCTQFCLDVNSQCGGYQNIGYYTNDTCLETCQLLPQGDTTDTSGNTAGCRQYYLNQPSPNCIAASVGGGQVCGNYCTAYCFFMAQTCLNEFLDPTQSSPTFDNVACQALCSQLPLGSDDPYDTAANSLQCRVFHAGASWVNPSIHCPHASLGGADQCGTGVEAYCNLIQNNCPSMWASAFGSSSVNCSTQASTLNDTNFQVQFGPTLGDFLGCRVYWAGLPSYYSSSTACANAAIVSSACVGNGVTPAPTPLPKSSASILNFGYAVIMLIVLTLIA